MARSGYDKIAAEYYDSQHITSRNFDNTTTAALRDHSLDISDSPETLVLEIGAGKGRANEFLGVDSKQIVHLDHSQKMLELSNREPSLLNVFGDACDIPLVSNQFAAVVGFLVDPFLGLACLAESYRMLSKNGKLLLTVPTKEWGFDLRQRLGIDQMTTRFKVIGTEKTVLLPSLLYSKDELNIMLTHVGFRQVEISDHCLPQDENPVSEDILSVCESRDIATHELPVIHVIKALR